MLLTLCQTTKLIEYMHIQYLENGYENTNKAQLVNMYISNNQYETVDDVRHNFANIVRLTSSQMHRCLKKTDLNIL